MEKMYKGFQVKAFFLYLNRKKMKLHWLLRNQKGIPVLMYHRIWPGTRDRITQTPEQLTEQWNYLHGQGYHTLSLDEYLDIANGKKKNNGRNVLITFDDGYYNNLTYAYPLLKQFQFKATIFIIGDTLEGNLNEDDPLQKKMNVDELKSLNPEIIQLAMHGFHHENFKTTSLQEIKNAIRKSINSFHAHGLPLHKSIAYPYGGRPADKKQFDELKRWMHEQGIEAAFRIGNEVSSVPATDLYEIKRIDIRGTDSFEDFKIKLKKGKLRPF